MSLIKHKEPQSYDCVQKLLLIGESGVGKTSIMNRLDNKKFSESHITTIGIDFRTKNYNINNLKVKLQIWDTAGQERFHSITSSYYRGANCILLFYDVTDQTTFDRIEYWLNDIQTHQSQQNSQPTQILVGNKCDLEEDRVITFSQGQKLAEKYNMLFYEMSAKIPLINGRTIHDIFQEIMTYLVTQMKSKPNLCSQPNEITLNPRPNTKNKCCN